MTYLLCIFFSEELQSNKEESTLQVNQSPKVNGSSGRGRLSNVNKAAAAAVLHDEKALAGKPAKLATIPPQMITSQVKTHSKHKNSRK